MIVLGVILLVIGFLFGISILWTIGLILAVIGVVLWILGAMGHAVAWPKALLVDRTVPHHIPEPSAALTRSC